MNLEIIANGTFNAIQHSLIDVSGPPKFVNASNLDIENRINQYYSMVFDKTELMDQDTLALLQAQSLLLYRGLKEPLSKYYSSELSYVPLAVGLATSSVFIGTSVLGGTPSMFIPAGGVFAFFLAEMLTSGYKDRQADFEKPNSQYEQIRIKFIKDLLEVA